MPRLVCHPCHGVAPWSGFVVGLGEDGAAAVVAVVGLGALGFGVAGDEQGQDGFRGVSGSAGCVHRPICSVIGPPKTL